MDFVTIILGILAMVVFVLPVYYIQRVQKKKAGKVAQAFLEAAKEQGLHLSKYDFWNEQYGIGLDEVKNKLYFWHNDAQHPQKVVVDLSSIRKSAVDNVFREVNGNRIIDLIALRLSLQGPKPTELTLAFYNKENTMMLSDELLLASKWDGIIQSKLVQAPQTQKV